MGFFQPSITQNPIKDFCAVSFDAYESDPPPEISSSFTEIQFSNLDNFTITDDNANFSPATNVYIVPKSGYYTIITNFRLADNVSEVSYGQGAHTSNADNPYFLWSVSNAYRNGSINIRATYFNAQDEIRMIAYADTSTVFIRGAMTIIPLGS